MWNGPLRYFSQLKFDGQISQINKNVQRILRNSRSMYKNVRVKTTRKVTEIKKRKNFKCKVWVTLQMPPRGQ
jgi:hypothetical protein